MRWKRLSGGSTSLRCAVSATRGLDGFPDRSLALRPGDQRPILGRTPHDIRDDDHQAVVRAAVSGGGGQVVGGPAEIRRGPKARIIAATQPMPVGALIRLTRKTSANLSTLRIRRTSVGSRYTTASATKAPEPVAGPEVSIRLVGTRGLRQPR